MKLFEPQNLSEEYREHSIFSTLKELIGIYDSISFTSFGFISEGLKVSITNMDSYIASSIGGTLDSICTLLEKARINDAISLVRKYYDEILFDIYQTIVRRDEVKNHADEFLYVQPDIQKWREGIFRTPSVQKTLHYMESSPSYSDLYKFFDFKVHYDKIRTYLDDNLHINGFLHLIKNDNHIVNNYRVKYLSILEGHIVDLFTLHFSSILYLNPL